MKETRFLDILGDIDEAYITEAEAVPCRKRTVWPRWVAAAACVALVATAAFGVARMKPTEDVVYPQIQEYEENGEYFAFCQVSSGIKLTFAQLADEADVILCADVTRTELIPSGETAYTSHATVRVREVLKGDVRMDKSYVVKDSGSVNMKGRGFLSCGFAALGPLMEEGNRVVLFLKDGTGSANDPFRIHEPTAGKFYLDADGKYHNAVLYSTYKGEGERYQESELSDLKPKTLDEIKTLINEAGLLYAYQDERVALLDDSALDDKVYSIPGLTNAADVIVSADVTKTWLVPRDDGTAACYVQLVVLNALKGDTAKGETITVCDNGIAYVDESGEATGYASYCGGPLMRVGNRVLLFLSASGAAAGSEEHPYTITTGVSGKYYYTRYGSYCNSMCYSAEEVSWDERSRVAGRVAENVGSLADYKQLVWPLL